jgi:Holliday junction resolvasome RuvABC endonuclease subunit
MTKIIGLDASTAVVGWAWGTESSRFESGSIVTPKRDQIGEKLHLIYTAVRKVISSAEPDLVMVEEPFFPVHMGQPFKKGAPAVEGVEQPPEKFGGAAFSPNTIKALQKVAGIIEAAAAADGIPVEMCAPSAWRKTFFGYGSKPKGDPSFDWKKEAVRRAKMFGYETGNADEAEAIGILYHALHGAGASARKQGSLLDMGKSLL